MTTTAVRMLVPPLIHERVTEKLHLAMVFAGPLLKRYIITFTCGLDYSKGSMYSSLCHNLC